MIRWIMTRMEENPNAAFSGAELAGRFPEALTGALQSGLLRRMESGIESRYYDSGLNTPRLVVAGEAGLEAIDEDDPEVDPIHLTPDDLARYTLDIEAFAGRVQQASGLLGKPASLTDRLFFLGESKEDPPVAYVLALLNESPIMQSIVPNLPNVLPKGYRTTVVAYPSQLPPPTERRRLEDLGIRVTLIPDSYVLPTYEALSRELVMANSGFELKDDTLHWRGKVYRLTTQLAALIKVLADAQAKEETPLRWKEIQTRLKTYKRHPTRMKDILRKSPLRNTFIVRTGKDSYHLER